VYRQATTPQQALQTLERDVAQLFQGLATLFRDAFNALEGQRPPTGSGSSPDGFDGVPGTGIPPPSFSRPPGAAPTGPGTDIRPPVLVPPSASPTAPASGNWITAKPDHFEATHDYSIRQLNVDGRNVYAFTVKDGDVQTWDAHNVGPGGKPNERAEIGYAAAASGAKGNSPYNVTAQTGKQSYKMSVMFDQNNWPSNSRWATLLQFHPQDDGKGGGFAFSGISVHGNSLDVMTPFSQDGNQFITRVPIKPGQWYDLRLDVNWSSKSDGYVKVYDGDKLLGEYHGPTAKDGAYYYLKQGYYRDGAISQTGTVYESPLQISKG
jgi:hypothetical protein